MISIMRASRRYPLFLLFAACATLGSGKEFTLGLLIPYHELPHSKVSGVQGMYYAPSIIQALEDVNNRSDLLPGHHLSFIWNNTKCDETQSIQALTYLVHEKHVSAIIGPACSCKTEARLASALDIPMVSYVSCALISRLHMIRLRKGKHVLLQRAIKLTLFHRKLFIVYLFNSTDVQ